MKFKPNHHKKKANIEFKKIKKEKKLQVKHACGGLLVTHIVYMNDKFEENMVNVVAIIVSHIINNSVCFSRSL